MSQDAEAFLFYLRTWKSKIDFWYVNLNSITYQNRKTHFW